MYTIQQRYLIEKIWRAREIPIGDQISTKSFGLLKESVHNFLGSLHLSSLRRLARIVSERSSNACFYIETTNNSEGFIIKQRYIILRVWRWPDIKDSTVLKHIEGSSSGDEATCGMADCLCVNPFHFTRISKRDIPYKGFGNKTRTLEDSGLSCGTIETECEEKTRICDVSTAYKRRDEIKKQPWLTVAYWEQGVRVGRMFYCSENTIDVYEKKTKNHRMGLCLKDFDRQTEMKESTRTVLKHIGEGIQVSLENGNIWIYNRSESPVFLNGELLQTLHNTDQPRVEKLPGGYGIMVYDCSNVTQNDGGFDGGKDEEHCLRVSFVKGFGRGYKRQTIMNCPCWIEMFFTLHKSQHATLNKY